MPLQDFVSDKVGVCLSIFMTLAFLDQKEIFPGLIFAKAFFRLMTCYASLWSYTHQLSIFERSTFDPSLTRSANGLSRMKMRLMLGAFLRLPSMHSGHNDRGVLLTVAQQARLVLVEYDVFGCFSQRLRPTLRCRRPHIMCFPLE